jgi:hypothetical protein
MQAHSVVEPDAAYTLTRKHGTVTQTLSTLRLTCRLGYAAPAAAQFLLQSSFNLFYLTDNDSCLLCNLRAFYVGLLVVAGASRVAQRSMILIHLDYQ